MQTLSIQNYVNIDSSSSDVKSKTLFFIQRAQNEMVNKSTQQVQGNKL